MPGTGGPRPGEEGEICLFGMSSDEEDGYAGYAHTVCCQKMMWYPWFMGKNACKKRNITYHHSITTVVPRVVFWMCVFVMFCSIPKISVVPVAHRLQSWTQGERCGHRRRLGQECGRFCNHGGAVLNGAWKICVLTSLKHRCDDKQLISAYKT